jgi:Uma2 family endonuclease
MSTATPERLMTSDDLFAMRPSQNVDRWLFRGQLRESKVTKRNPSHSAAVMTIGKLLGNWLDKQRSPHGRLYGGETCFRIRKDPETNVGIDVAVSTPTQAARTSRTASYVDGAPILAVEVLSPYDKLSDIAETIEEYLDCGVKVVWIVDPRLETVTIHRPSADPVMVNRSQELVGGKDLPGFRCQVSDIFE